MQKRHIDRQQYFNEQYESTKKFILPYILKEVNNGNLFNNKEIRVLEIGCGEGGNLLPFLEAGCECCGVEISAISYNNALKFYEDNPLKSNLQLINKNIFDTTSDETGGVFDIVVLRDVIEHIPDQELFLRHLKNFVSQDGILFIAFPPWRMPFGGHQQIIKKKWVSIIPYIHISPKPIYTLILKCLRIPKNEINGLLNIASTGISIKRFKKIIQKEDYLVIKKTHWLINPNYQIKFGLKPRKAYRFFQIPYLQDFYTTAVYYLLRQKIEKIRAKE
ncbi:MAG: class I SAM-dependent methyltransferase [Bacteroidales bacterium]|jgi:SAM-dependent methyltransferase|nr:class I SAM-dependent methyltransferase [Bacteroidales bacterium]